MLAGVDTTITKLVTARRLARTGEGRQLRERSDLTIKELAQAVGVDTATLVRWEEGRTRPRAPAALRWVDALAAVTASADDPT
jgi:DNA-binding transcriptional regulator YiaG